MESIDEPAVELKGDVRREMVAEFILFSFEAISSDILSSPSSLNLSPSSSRRGLSL